MKEKREDREGIKSTIGPFHCHLIFVKSVTL